MATIALKNMRFYAHHGCFEQERQIGTLFSVNLSFQTDTSRAELSDNIADTVNYSDVYQTVKIQMAHPSHLLEHVARRVGEALLCDYPAITAVDVEVSKLNPPLGGQMDAVSVALHLER